MTPKASLLSRREKDRLRNRALMLSAALNLFSEKGFANVSMHEIARSAEFAIGTLYKFFKNKEDLYNTLLLEIAEQFRTTLTGVLEKNEDPHQRVRNYTGAFGHLFMANARAVRLYFAETFGGGFHIRAALTAQLRAYYDEGETMLAGVFAEGIRRGIYRPLNPHYLAMTLNNTLTAFLFKWLDDPENHPFVPNIPVIETIFFEGVTTTNKGDDSDERNEPAFL